MTSSSSAMESYVFYWNEFQANIAASLQELRADEEFFDVTLSVDEENQIRAHRVILAASSDYFRAILKRHANTPNPVLVMPSGVKHSELSSLVHFMYNGEVSILEDQIESFMSLAETMKVKGLVEDKIEEKPVKVAPKMPKLPPGINVRIDRSSSSSEFGSPLRNEPSSSPAATKQRPGPKPGTNRPTGPGKATPNQLVKNPNMSANNSQLPQSSTSHDVAEEGASFNESTYEEGEFAQFGVDANGSSEEPSGSSQPQAVARPGPSLPASGPQAGTRLVALQCPKCPNRLPGVEAFKEHMETAHGEGKNSNEEKPQPPSEDVILCSICDKSFKNKRYMVAHQKRVHKVGVPEGAGTLGEPPAKKGRKPKAREMDEEQLAQMEGFVGEEEAYMDEESEMAQMHHQEMPKPKGMGGSKAKQSASANGDPLERLPHGEGSSGMEGSRVLAPGGGARGPQRPRPPNVPAQFAADGGGRGRGRGKRGRPPGSLNKSPMVRQPRPDSSSGSGSGSGNAGGRGGRGNSMDLQRLGMKLGGQISISSSDQAGPRRSASGSSDGRPGYSITKFNEPSASGSGSYAGNSMRPSTSRAGSDMPAIVKQEPMESHFVNAEEHMYDEDEDYGDYEDGGADGGYDIDGAEDLYGEAGAYEEGLDDGDEYEGYDEDEDGVYGEATPK